MGEINLKWMGEITLTFTPDLTPICMDHYEHEALKSLYENISDNFKEAKR
ncbi:hypothetical protein KY366_06805 [Candidatus Woesearchaeota archaeon]|nr:hypothetical protein [Candidatus Woesearchaeota archaeon]